MDYLALIVGAIFIGIYKFLDFVNKAQTSDIMKVDTRSRMIVLGVASLYFALGIFLIVIGIVPAFTH